LVSGSGNRSTYTRPPASWRSASPTAPHAWLEAGSSTGRVHNYLEAPEQSDWTVKVRARSHGGDIIVHRACHLRGTDRAHLASPGSRDGQRPRLSPPMPSSPCRDGTTVASPCPKTDTEKGQDE
jgi:hypothetical protein